MSKQIYNEARHVARIDMPDGTDTIVEARVSMHLDEGLGVAVFYGSCVIGHLWAPSTFDVREVLGVMSRCHLASAIRAAISLADLYFEKMSKHEFIVDEIDGGLSFR